MQYNKELALDLQEKYKLSASYIEEWEKANQIPSFFSHDRVIEKNDLRVQKIIRVHSDEVINSSKLAHKKVLIWNLKQPIQKRVSEIEVELELLRIEELKNFLASILDVKLEDSDLYKNEMQKVLFDKRIMYSKITPNSSYNTFRKRWKEDRFDKINSEMLHTERNALQKLYDMLFPISIKTYSTQLNFFPNQSPIKVSVEAKSREEAFGLLKTKFPNDNFSINNLVESNSTYNRLEEAQDDFTYAEDTEQNINEDE